MTGLVAFSYSVLAPELADRLRGQAERIRQRIAGQTEAMIEIGRDLAAVKASTEHGTFLAWVAAECGIHPRMAQMYMRAAEWAEANTKLISHLQPTAVLKLAGKSTPPEVHQEVELRVDRGERVTPTAVDDLLWVARDRRRREKEEAKLSERTRQARAKRTAAADAASNKFAEARNAERQAAQADATRIVDILRKRLHVDEIKEVMGVLKEGRALDVFYDSGRRSVPLVDALDDFGKGFLWPDPDEGDDDSFTPPTRTPTGRDWEAA